MEFTSARSLLDTSQQAEDDLQQEPTPPSPLVQQSALRLTSQAGDASSTAAAGEAEVASEAAAETTGIAAPGIIILSPRQSPTPPPIFPSLTALFPPAAIPSQRRTNMTRIAALSNYLLRRQQATSAASPTTPASPPRELADWLAIESQSDAELQEEVGRLIQIERGYADEERRTEEEQVGYWRERAEEARRDMRRETELEMQEVEEEADEQALFVSSLRAGDSSRDRRRRRRRAGGEVDPDQPQPQALDDDALFRQFLTDEMDRRSSIFGGDLEAMEEASNVVDLTNEDEWGGFPPLPSRYTAESARPEDTWRLVETGAAAERADGGADGVGVTGRLWRHTPIDIPRNRTRPVFSFNPPGSSTNPYPPPSSYPFSPIHSDTDEPIAASAGEREINPSGVPRAAPRASLFEDAAEVEARRRSQAPPPTYRTIPTTSRTRDIGALAGAEGGRQWPPWTRVAPLQPPQPQEGARGRGATRPRSREETTALMGQTLRMRKPVVLLYCGGMGGDGGNGGGRLPSGFHWSGEEGGSGVSEEMGCGALVCARGLAEVPRRHFSDQINELSVAGEAAVSSDLPPSSKRVGDVYPGERERVGIRGVGGLCEGCRVKDVACTACGNVLGFRVLRPCLPCTSPRPPAGSGATDGLLWHFRRASVTLRPRLVGVAPPLALGEVFKEDQSEEEVEEKSRQEPEPPLPAAQRMRLSFEGRIEPRAPERGSKMKWGQMPEPQRDFETSLIGEPAEWLLPHRDSDRWWLENAVDKHCRGQPGRRGRLSAGQTSERLLVRRTSEVETTVEMVGETEFPPASVAEPTPRIRHSPRLFNFASPDSESDEDLLPPPSRLPRSTIRTSYDTALRNPYLPLSSTNPNPNRSRLPAHAFINPPPAAGPGAPLSRSPAVRLSLRRGRGEGDVGGREGEEGRSVRARRDPDGLEDVGLEGVPAVGYGSWRREVGGAVETEEERAEGRMRERARAGR